MWIHENPAQDAQRARQDAPKTAQDRPGTPQDEPKAPPRPPKRPPGRPKTAPRRPKAAPRRPRRAPRCARKASGPLPQAAQDAPDPPGTPREAQNSRFLSDLGGSVFLGIRSGFDVSHAAFEDMLYRLNVPKKKCCTTFLSGKPRTSCEPHTPLIDEPRPTH